ncbi:MAG: hypothetical protein ACFCUX_01015 [Candidatus Methylacidiphilales bacterium]
MKCHCCQSESATLFLSQVVQGTLIKLDLCAACARRLEVSDVQGIVVEELLKKMEHLKIESPVEKHPPCPCCGIEIKMVREHLQMGCGHCYIHFSEVVASLLERTQRGDHHTGKRPTLKPD